MPVNMSVEIPCSPPLKLQLYGGIEMCIIIISSSSSMYGPVIHYCTSTNQRQVGNSWPRYTCSIILGQRVTPR